DLMAEWRLFCTYYDLLQVERPDMVISYSIKPNIYGGYACRLLGIPYCVNVQGLGTPFQRKSMAGAVTILYRAALRKASKVFFENEDNAREFLNRRIIPQEKAVVLRGAGVNLEYYQVQPYPSEAGGIHFLFLGRIMREKGVDELFAAAQLLREKYGAGVVLDLVGFFEDEYSETVQQLVRDGVVVFHGFQADPRPFYARAHCVVLPSYHEGMSNVLLEAAATGRALITSDIPGCREAVEPNVSGYLCRPKNTVSLLEQMDRFMQLTSEQRAAMGAAGRRKMSASFDKYAVVQQTLDNVLPEVKTEVVVPAGQ
ncbi:MAG: glycosyltransferase family 4 protein, partial [Gemmiger sp.]